jgi:hypothetical protein
VPKSLRNAQRFSSGSACFTLARTLAEAEAIAARLAARRDSGDPACAAIFAVRCSWPA